ncbi:MAG: PQQ-binding-like beta-propeller repeat protein [Actinomycetota bacterium]
MNRVKACGVVAGTVVLLVASMGPVRARDWYVAGGGDNFRSGYNSEEKPPYFVRSGKGAIQPKPEWITKFSDLPSGVFPMGGLIVAEGKVIFGGGSTNSIVALNQETGLPEWRFQPDPRGSRFNPGDGYSGNYPATNAPWYNDGVVYGTFSNGTLYALSASSGQKIWRWEVPAPGAPGEVTDHVLDAEVEWDYTNPDHAANPLRAEVAPFTGDYPKFNSAVSYCDDQVFVMTLDSRVFAVDATSGRTQWHRYVGAPDWPGEFVWPEFEKGGIVPSSGRSTRRFEAQAGAGCLGEHLFVPVEDGFVKLLDKDTGRFLGAYNALHAGDLGFAHDIGAGLADPESGDIIVNTLSNRMIRLSVPGLEPRWRHTEDAGQLSLCLNRTDRSTCTVIPTSQDVQIDGPIGGSVFGGNLVIDYEHRVIGNPNEDGHLYIWDDIDVEGQNPNLIARIANGDNPLAVENPDPDSLSYYLPRGQGGPWEQRTTVLSSAVAGGGVIYYNATWEHAIYGVQYLDAKTDEVLAEPKVVFRYEAFWDDTFPYPPFGDTFDEPIIDIDLLTMGSPALVDGHLYTQINDGSIYSFDLEQPVAETQRNLAVLGSGLVPFIPTWDDPRGAFDRIWTPADWYKNQIGPKSFRLPTPAMAIPFGTPLLGLGVWLYLRRRRSRDVIKAGASVPRGEYLWP